MKKIIILLVLSFTLLLFAENKYWYMRKDGSCFMVSKEKMDCPDKIEFYQETKPTKEQVKNKLSNKLSERTFTETEIQKIIEDYLNSEKGKTKIKEIITQ